jgi:4'-phosphopantetheinyl transferase
MNSGEQQLGNADEEFVRPTLREWKRGAAVCGLAGDEIGVWLVELDSGLASQAEIDGAEPGLELELLDADERVRAARFVRARDRRRFARCRSALREILGGLLGVHPEGLRFRTVARGKPELDFISAADGRPALRFNLSHSADLAVIAVCHGRELGIDLEQLRSIGEAQRIVESFFSKAEQAEFATISDADRPLAFVRGWTRKEAILKGLGVGIAGLADRHETGFGSGEMPAQFAPAVPCSRVGDWRLWEASPRAGFVATLACRVDREVDSAPTKLAEGGAVAPAPPPDSGADSVH